jgi:hypothetical protein
VIPRSAQFDSVAIVAGKQETCQEYCIFKCQASIINPFGGRVAEGKLNVIREGAHLLWRRQRVLWWLYGINLFLGLIGTLPVANNVGTVLNHSFAAEHLVRSFDLSFFAELAAQPSHPLSAGAPASILLAVAFFVLWLLFEGGILETYQRDSRLTTSEFFEACGRMFWRFVRLLICMLIVLVPVVIATRGVKRWSDKLATDSPRALMGFWVEVVSLLAVALLLMAVRLWFDMAQVRAVAENERLMGRALVHALSLTLANFTTLFGIYMRISLIAWAFSAAAFWAWIKLVQPQWIGVSFFLGQAVLLVWLGTRLWQRASEMLWYQKHRPAPPPPWESWFAPVAPTD